MEQDQDCGTVTVGKCYVHLHDASNYLREVLGTPEWAVSTRVADNLFIITVRYKGSLDMEMVSIKLLDGHTDRVKPRHLNWAVARLKKAKSESKAPIKS